VLAGGPPLATASPTASLGPRCCIGISCRQETGELGDHCAASPLSGRSKRRAMPAAKRWARALPDGGAQAMGHQTFATMGQPGAARVGREDEVRKAMQPRRPVHTSSAGWPRLWTGSGQTMRKSWWRPENTWRRSLILLWRSRRRCGLHSMIFGMPGLRPKPQCGLRSCTMRGSRGQSPESMFQSSYTESREVERRGSLRRRLRRSVRKRRRKGERMGTRTRASLHIIIQDATRGVMATR
jgi:hypothetical protein